MKNTAYLLIHHSKGIDWSEGYGTETVKGVALTEHGAKVWCSKLKEDGFERRIYKKIGRL